MVNYLPICDHKSSGLGKDTSKTHVFYVVFYTQDIPRVLKSLCGREYVWEHGNMTENFSDECALREFMRI